jgi:hypothetical protein
MRSGRPNDTMTGVILSPVFVLLEPTVSFLVGGGSHADTYVALCTEGADEVLRASGKNTEVMQRVAWDAGQYVGRRVFVKIADGNRGSWGHVTFDDFRAAGRIDPAAMAELAKRYVELERAEQAKREAERAERLVELMTDERLFARGEQRIYRGDNLGAISLPVGGIGAGSIELSGHAAPAIWHIFNNFACAAVPHSFLAVRAKRTGAEPVVRALQTRPVGPFAAVEALSFRGEYPLGWFHFEDRELPVRVRLEAFNPLIPLDTRSSAMPCAIYNLTADNPGRDTVHVAFLASQQNAVGFTGTGQIDGRSCPEYGANSNRVLREKSRTLLHMTASIDEDAPGYGDMTLAAVAGRAAATAQWEDLAELAADFAGDGRVSGPASAGPSPAGQTVDGAQRAARPAAVGWPRKHVRQLVAQRAGCGPRTQGPLGRADAPDAAVPRHAVRQQPAVLAPGQA